MMLNTELNGIPKCLSVAGVLAVGESIPIEIPKTLNPDVAVDADWQPLVLKDEAVVLSSTNLAEAILVGLIIRIDIPITVADVGVRWS